MEWQNGRFGIPCGGTADRSIAVARHRAAIAMRKPTAVTDAHASIARIDAEIARVTAMLDRYAECPDHKRAVALRRWLSRADQNRRDLLPHLVDIVVDGTKRTPGNSDVGPTPETAVHHARRRGDPIERLVAAGTLTVDDERAADEILEIYAGMTAGVCVQAPAYDGTRVDGWREYSPPLRLDRLYRWVFCPWAARTSPPALRICLAVCVQRAPLDHVRRLHSVSMNTAVVAVRDGLGVYRMLRRHVAV